MSVSNRSATNARISFQNTRWPDQDPSFTLSSKLPAVSTLSLLGWREICALRGQVSPRLMRSSIASHTLVTVFTSALCFLYVHVSSSRTDLVPPLPVTRTADVPGSSSTPAQVSRPTSLKWTFSMSGIKNRKGLPLKQRTWIINSNLSN